MASTYPIFDAVRDSYLTYVPEGHQKDFVESFLKRAFRRVYNGILLSEATVRSISAGDERLPEGLVSLATAETLEQRGGIFVFVFDQTYPAGALSPERLVRLPPTMKIEDVRKCLLEHGLRLDRLARVVTGDDDDALWWLGLLRDTPQAAPDSNIPPAFLLCENKSPDDPYAVLEDDGLHWRAKVPSAKEDLFVAIHVEDSVQKTLISLLDELYLHPRINMTESAQAIQSGAIVSRFERVSVRAKQNVERARDILKQSPFSPLAGLKGDDTAPISPRCSPFDPHSGAISFSPDEWREMEETIGVRTRSPASGPKKILSRTAHELVRFFRQTLPDTLENDRPCYKNILYTPTRVLLRGEQYYVNMRRESPFVRLHKIWAEMDELRRVNLPLRESIDLDNPHEWKLILAFLDQIRNIALQTFSFTHAAASLHPDLREDFQQLWGNREHGIHAFTYEAIRAYYSALFGKAEEASTAAHAAIDYYDKIGKELRQATARAASLIDNQRRSRPEKVDDISELVRGWREADHPGENLLTCLLAWEQFKSTPRLHVVGVGWGGIELPLVYDYLARTRLLDIERQERHAHIARWSHYRAPYKDPEWHHFPAHDNPDFSSIDIGGDPVALFDDNSLTGITLERIRDELIVAGAGKISMFLTRYSGERRHAQMMMDRHGAIDPDILYDRIQGYLGETPFARSWSRKKYTNPIGVFSLSRRRILECIHNNSTVEMYDREGF